jgi:hypothetical protein
MPPKGPSAIVFFSLSHIQTRYPQPISATGADAKNRVTVTTAGGHAACITCSPPTRRLSPSCFSWHSEHDDNVLQCNHSSHKIEPVRDNALENPSQTVAMTLKITATGSVNSVKVRWLKRWLASLQI